MLHGWDEIDHHLYNMMIGRTRWDQADSEKYNTSKSIESYSTAETQALTDGGSASKIKALRQYIAFTKRNQNHPKVCSLCITESPVSHMRNMYHLDVHHEQCVDSLSSQVNSCETSVLPSFDSILSTLTFFLF